MINPIKRVLLSRDQIRDRVSYLAAEITNNYSDRDNLLIVSILRGAFIFTADLTRELDITHQIDFMALTSYHKDTSTGEVRIISDLRQPIEGRNVLIVEDIVDSGRTLRYLCQLFKERHPISIETCVLVTKDRPTTTDEPPNPDYLGFEIPDVWVVGYGLDYDDRYRTLPYIAELNPEIYRETEHMMLS